MDKLVLALWMRVLLWVTVLLLPNVLSADNNALPPTPTEVTPGKCALSPSTEFWQRRVEWSSDTGAGGFSPKSINSAYLSGADPFTYGSGISVANVNSITEISGVNQSNYADAYIDGDYIEYTFRTAASLGDTAVLSGLSENGGRNGGDNYKMDLLLSDDGFTTAVRLISGYSVDDTITGGATDQFSWIYDGLAQVYLEANTEYKLRAVMYNAVEVGGIVTMDDFAVSVDYCGDMGDAPYSTDGANGGTHLLPEIRTHYIGSVSPDAEHYANSDDNTAGDVTTDEESGVTLPTFKQGDTATVTVPVTGAGGLLNAWIDWDNNKVFDADEKIASDVTLAGGAASGTISLNVTVPGDAAIGSSYARFRWSPNTVSNPTDDVEGGELEDYAITVEQSLDWPTPPVTGSGGGGECVLTHHQNSGVLADPNSFYNITDHTDPDTLTKIGPWNVASGTVEGLTADVASKTFYALNANRGGRLWLGELDPVSGSFSDITTTGSATLSHSTYGSLSIHQSRSLAHQPGTNELWVAAYNTQPTSGPGDTYVYLFKISAITGEVLTGAFSGEDYVAINLAPYTFNTNNERPSVEALTFYKNEPNILYGVLSTLSGGTPKVGHLFAVDLSLSSPEAVLAPNNLSGVAYSGGAAPSSSYYDIEGMSFDKNGDLIIVSSNVGGANANSLYTVDLASGVASNKRTIISGDWEGIVCDLSYPKDYGDAPVTGTAPDTTSTNSYGVASHQLAGDLKLGAVVDEDTANQPDANATGDDNDGTDDEDGILLPALIAGATQYSITSADITAVGDGTLHAWIDFDGNGAFDADEHSSVAISGGTASGALSWTMDGAGDPNFSLSNGSTTFARFRFTSDTSVTESTPASVASDGEVEDYVLQVSVGVKVSGRVFIDADGDGVNDAGELGIVRHTIVLRETDSGVCQSAYTDSDGNYAFSAVPAGSYQVYQAQGESVPVPGDCDPAGVTNPLGYQSTSPDSLSFNIVATDVINQNFGEVKAPIFEPDHQSEVLPGNVVFYAHKFSSLAAGSVRFTTADDLSTMPGWSHAIYRDANCDGVLNGSEAAAIITGMNFGVAAAGSFCIINKVFAPANLPQGERYRVTTNAVFSYASATADTVNLVVRDVTTVGANVSPAVPATPVVPATPETPEVAATPVTPAVGASRLVLRKTVQNVTQNTDETATVNQAAPGDRLTYRVYYRNVGTGPITDLQVNDVVPDFTEYVSGTASCDGEPSGLNCTPRVSGSYLEWVFTGILSGGAQGSVSYDVKLDN